MTHSRSLDCVVIGYYEPPFDDYERLIRQYGADSEAYRDLQFSFVDLDGRRRNYVDLLNYAHQLAHRMPDGDRRHEPFKSGEIPNLAAVYLTNFLRNQGLRARYVNLFLYEQERLLECLAQNPYCVAITTTFYVLNSPVIEIVKFIRAHNPGVRIVVGGPLVANHRRNYRSEDTPIQVVTAAARRSGSREAANDPFRSALEDMGADIYVCEGQGELTLARIVACLRDGGDLASIPNLAFFDSGRLVVTPVVAENNSLDEHGIRWTRFADQRLGPTIQTRTARSCAFNCSFCNYPRRAGKLTLASLDTIREELDSMRELGDVQNVVFIDDTFNVPLPRFKDICRMMIDRHYGFSWFSYLRCSNADAEAIELAAKSGCRGVFLGIESGSPSILKNMNKAATVEKYAEGIRQLRDHGIITFASFITGFPGETNATVDETIDFIRTHKPDYYRSQLWYCEPGTPIDDQREKHAIQGHGFVWSHRTMESLAAMDHIDRLFLSVTESAWLPQWSFDFWIIPYLLGKGISVDGFSRFMGAADRMLALEIASVRPEEKHREQQAQLQAMTAVAAGWPVN
jgi:radical SAM PhpK family P-methyltransferase